MLINCVGLLKMVYRYGKNSDIKALCLWRGDIQGGLGLETGVWNHVFGDHYHDGDLHVDCQTLR